MHRLLVSLATVTVTSFSAAQQLPEDWAENLHWRSIGPATMGGRIISLAVYEAEPTTWWAGTASGGLLKTTNNGITFEHQFDDQPVVSIGHVAVAQSNKDVVWVGTGEANPRNSVSYGNGVYKSIDGGDTWRHMGLDETFQIGRIAIHPTNPDIVYVGALGRLYGPNEARGLYKTPDGGATWEKIFYIDDKTGVIDIDMHPEDPSTLMVATYERERDGFDTNDPSKKYGPGSALWKTTDAGANWQRITEGLPTCDLGRIGVDYHRSDPNIVIAIVESEKIAKQPEDAPYLGVQLEAADAGVKITSIEGNRNNRGRGRPRPPAEDEGEEAANADTPAKQAGMRKGDVILAVDGQRVHSPEDVELQCRQHKAGHEVSFTIVRDRKDQQVTVAFGNQPENVRSPFTGTLGGQAANMQDMQGPNGHEYGGIYKSIDGGQTWSRVNSLNPRPMYYSQVRIDPSDPDILMVLGTSLYRSTDGGKHFDRNAGRGVHSDHHAQWINPDNSNHIIHGCDGGIYVTYDACRNWDHLNQVALGQFYHVGVSPERNYTVYGGLQDNGSWGGPSRTSGMGARNEDWIRIGGGDGFRCLVDPDEPLVVYSQSQNGPPGWRNLETGERGSLRSRRGGRGGDAERIRFNWETPYVLSAHNSKIVYTAGNRVFKSLNRGANLAPISPDITNTDRGSATALAESPRNADIVYVGTDDGALWVTHDGGDNWIDCFATAQETPTGAEEPENTEQRGPGLRAAEADGEAQPIAQLVPGPRWVSELVASQFEAKRAYVTLDAHRSDDDNPYVFVTEDGGLTWTSLTDTLPEGAGVTRTITEDPVNGDVLYLGTEFQAFVSLDQGRHWTRFNGNMPTVAVHALAVNVPSGEIVAGTHGRSLWITPVNEIRQMTKEVLQKPVHFYKPISAVVWKSEPSTGGTNRRFTAENPPTGARLSYHLTKPVSEASIEVLDGTGAVIRKLDGKTDAGLHVITWDLRGSAPAGNSSAPQRRWSRNRGTRAQPGVYSVRLTADGDVQSHPLTVIIDPDNPDPAWLSFEEEAELAADQDDDREEEHDQR
ncbi:MAG: PDZ domain-containing protein [Planctomycetota bacterium]|nr:PDZ domain-containing protein [Planctomycetota bacterium]